MSRLKRWLKSTPIYPALRALRHAFRRKSRVERIDRRDTRLTAAVLRRLLRRDDNCVDVGAHAGDFLREFERLSPEGRHTAIEPIPQLASALRENFPGVEVYTAALSDAPGTAEFHLVPAAPALSGIRPRPDLPPDTEVSRVSVRLARLDDLIPADRTIRLIKIDVEGAELGVLRGAAGTLARCRPWVVFEHGSASVVYGTTSADVFDELARHGLAVWNLGDWLANRPPLSRDAFSCVVESGEYWNFLAGPVGAL